MPPCPCPLISRPDATCAWISFRGLALWFIFLDHVPDNIVSWITVRNYGFSDATEIFVFISGYTAVIAYSRMMLRDGWPRRDPHLPPGLAALCRPHPPVRSLYRPDRLRLDRPRHAPA